MKHFWPEEIKDKARQLRKNGLTYGELIKKLNVSRSTLFSWIKDVKNPSHLTKEGKLKWLGEIRILAVKANKLKRENKLKSIEEKVKQDIKNFNLQDKNLLKAMLSSLYWAEGSKFDRSLAFANTDPKLSLLFITLLRTCHHIDESKLRIRLHVHYYHDQKKVKKFWSELLNISEDKIGKIYVKKRSTSKKFRKNFAGICFIRYYSDSLKEEILRTGYQIADIINNKTALVA